MSAEQPFLGASAVDKRLRVLRIVRRTLYVVSPMWAFVILRSQPDSGLRHFLFDLGIGLMALVVAGFVATPRSSKVSAVSAIDDPVDRIESSDTTSETQTIDASARPVWAEATWRALHAPEFSLLRRGVPDVAVIRVGVRGVELLLHESHPNAPAPFRAEAGGLTWSLDPSVALDTLIELGDEPSHFNDSSETLVEVGADEDGSYYVDPSKTSWLRLDDYGEILEDRTPAPGLPSPIGASLISSPLVVVERGEDRLLEPYGIVVGVRPNTHDAILERDEDDLPTRAGIAPAALEQATAEVDEEPDAARHDGPAANEVAPSSFLVPAGRVEVRILREVPDLVGELDADPTAGAIEFVAYLALHGHRVATARLKESLGTWRAKASRSGRTVWDSAGEARHAIGPDLVPGASGNQLYVLSEEVSCDWTRFRALVELAHQAGADDNTRSEALVCALELVDGVPGLASRRFSWLDTEGFLSDVALAVAAAALELVGFAADQGDEELSRWAIARARPLVPDLEIEREASRNPDPAPRTVSGR